MILQVDHSSHQHHQDCNGSNVINGGNATQPAKLLAQCEQGLYSILGTLENYSVAFEAIAGMRGESFERGTLLFLSFFFFCWLWVFVC